MKKIVLAIIVSGVFYFMSTYGYYYYLEDADPDRIYFKKESFTLRMRFYNIFANEGDDRPLSTLTTEQREKVIDYCKYRLGIITDLSTQDDLDRCKYGYTPSHFRRPPSKSVD